MRLTDIGSATEFVQRHMAEALGVSASAHDDCTVRLEFAGQEILVQFPPTFLLPVSPMQWVRIHVGDAYHVLTVFPDGPQLIQVGHGPSSTVFSGGEPRLAQILKEAAGFLQHQAQRA